MASFLSLTARPRQWALQTFLFIFFFVSYCCPSPVSQSAKLSKTGRSWCFYLPSVHDNNKNTRLVRDTQPTFAIRLMRERRSAERTVVFHQPFIIREGNWTSLRWQPPSLTPPLNLRTAQQKPPPHPFVFQKLLTLRCRLARSRVPYTKPLTISFLFSASIKPLPLILPPQIHLHITQSDIGEGIYQCERKRRAHFCDRLLSWNIQVKKK